ncbi:hypothetical protein [Acinetobacter genomosp. 15BJ]|uniref:Uncharacterized protein n=1 Tax=Acinetobacter genomosp. 15BJ TaxID=106651 RepID=R9AZZ7_9GAMM|nr:hypothetical protein [Acinetobacter genomosp. 15BJ]EOR07742.1 hypothetical protein F896_02115 [Acinetobacter genomosp. 15BJ]MDO3658168.1 hypothetical protein [Acinetobacter genomosp. 15BJ]
MKKVLLSLAILVTVSSGAMAADTAKNDTAFIGGGCGFSCGGGGR